jgi:hypothetical protein|tara:strand:+ start:3108 stop:3320 length:213 start_codon:yes stop_codon:yes gene_type:complete
MEQKLYMRPKEVEAVFSIKQSTLSKQREGKFGLPFTIVGRNPKKNRGGIILYKVSDINEYLERKGKNTLY